MSSHLYRLGWLLFILCASFHSASGEYLPPSRPLGDHLFLRLALLSPDRLLASQPVSPYISRQHKIT